ncbi:hypothetical protein EKO04_008861 [Ascochyta lentis]|uniref:Dynamin N-terminal domain-containing protein n=1 Tax=Ascochyta lentis TaxID=205686 RepID=A0A8H7IZ60_9PLEO|nr:hypothetical protein EKO04_008861 [Ascochyta lentis]
MSKRPLLPPSMPAKARACLNFELWKTLQVHLENSDYYGHNYIYDPSGEEMPDNSWYALDIDALRETIKHMCERLGRPIANCKMDDQEIMELLRTLEHARSTPAPKTINIAVVGHQGIGKSSIINALLNRDLVDVSASSSACTSFATIIEYKEGATDDTDLSDLKVTFLAPNEIRDFIEEQIRRYADVYAHFKFDDDIEPSEEESNEDDSSEDHLSDTSDNQVVSEKKMKKKVSKEVQRSAGTAEDFFRVMFNADADKEKEVDLQRWLSKPDLEDGQFLDHCTGLAMAHLAQIEAEESGSVEYPNVRDVDLESVRYHAASMWPLVKNVAISTGSVLLRNGIRFMDLPGYGDLNQTRAAIVNEYRRVADFEMVVAKSDRYLSKTDEDRYLSRATRCHGASNVFLVLNKADICLETPKAQVMRTVRKGTEEPFVSIGKQFSNIIGFAHEDPDTMQDYQKYLIKEAQMADGQYEFNKIRQKLQKKGVKTFSVSAARYLEWLDPDRLDHPPYTPSETGIPLLRQALLMLPAEANYQDLSTHVFETLADIQDKVSRILVKFTDDDDITSIRRYLLNRTPELSSKLRTLSTKIPHEIVPKAWDYAERIDIINGMANHIKLYSRVHYQTFWLMLRNNGIATHGRYAGKNLNEELLQMYKNTIKRWRTMTIPKSEKLARLLEKPIQAILLDLQRRMGEVSSDLKLKQRANEALVKLIHRVELARDRLLSRLEGSIGENYMHFTTEDDIKCPIAQQMKSAYVRIENMRRGGHRRHGIYRRQRKELILTTQSMNYGQPALVDAISSQVKTRQCEKWQAIEEDFITDILARFQDYTRILEELLENETYMSDAHKQVRKGLARKLPAFNKAFEEVKSQFPDSETQRPTKKARKSKIKTEME